MSVDTTHTQDGRITPPEPEELIRQLKATFEDKGLTEELRPELPVYENLIPSLAKQLEGQYQITSLINIGSTATVWEVYDWNLEQRRALKLPRPTLSKLAAIIRIVRAERLRLAALNHQNIIKIFTSREIDLEIAGEKYSFPYFVMEFLDGVQDFDDFILEQRKTLTAGTLISSFRDVLAGISFLHRQGIIHCDIKPGNILKSPARPPLIADLGYAKHLQRISQDDHKLTDVTFTRYYAHPELILNIKNSVNPNAVISEIPRNQLRPAFDLFALGRSMQEILIELRADERSDPDNDFGHKSLLTPYQWSYLGLISKRLLDGYVEKRSDDELESDSIPELPEPVMPELKYQSADEALEDAEKLLHLYDLEGEIEELNPNLPTFIQIPGCRVPSTDRVREVINHPTFARLAQVTQLGFVSLVYPGASHTRFEHVLGTFSRCCEYMRALWYDPSNCLFQAIMSKDDIELGLLSALLHDIGQYPMAHDLTEISSRFAHEKYTEAVLQNTFPGKRESLAEVIRAAWHREADEVLDVIHADENSSFRHRILHSLISGPLDCDKLDYLGRDSTHLGIMLGSSVDQERLIRNLTLAYKLETEREVDKGRPQIRQLEFVGIGVAEKALVVGQSVFRGRKDMFTQVYWQHTTRAVKAMLAFVVRRILIRLSSEEQQEDFWYRFKRFVFSPMELVIGGAFAQATQPAVDDRLGIAPVQRELLPSSCSHLTPSDDAALLFLWQFADKDERRMLRAIQDRQLYRRLAVLSGVRRRRPKYQAIYERFRNSRLDEDLKAIEERRQEWERQIIATVADRLDEDSNLVPVGFTKEQIVAELNATIPLILVDIPVKAISRTSEPTKLYYLREDIVAVHSRPSAFFPDFDELVIDLEESGFDIDVGKIRVVAHPRYRDFLDRCMRETAVIDILMT